MSPFLNTEAIEVKSILEEIQEEGKGYNEVILKQDKTLKDICANDKTFEQDFHKYLQSFDLKIFYGL